MNKIDINIELEQDQETESTFQKAFEDYDACLLETNSIYISKFIKLKEEKENNEKLEDKIKILKQEFETINSNIKTHRKKGDEIKLKLLEIENQQEKFCNDSETYKKLKNEVELYEQYLNCQLTYYAPDIYKLTIFKGNRYFSIEFRYDGYKDIKTILAVEPSDYMYSDLIERFRKIDDTPLVLCVARHALLSENKK